MSISIFCGMERFEESWFWASEAEKEAFFEVKENLSAFIETKKEGLHLGIFGEQLLEPIIAEQALVFIGKQKKMGYLIGAIEEDMQNTWAFETIKDMLVYIEDLDDLEIYGNIYSGYPCVYVSDTNTISYRAASDIVYHTIESKYYQMLFQLYPIMQDYESLIS